MNNFFMTMTQHVTQHISADNKEQFVYKPFEVTWNFVSIREIVIALAGWNCKPKR